MAETSMLQIFEQDGITNVEFVETNILDEICISRIGDELSSVVERKACPKVILNFKNVHALSSSALGMLITVNTKIGDKNGKLVLASLDGPIRDVFRITKLDKAFSICDTLADAMGSVRK
ncbi:MAG: STAS domain-containing protein [Phycisphaerales bacterium]|nr:STAS domain-containing protein [Planctomycetota bacterium]MBL6997454.1 STAS domain-containing protein [Phycisphaerales bacterium]